MFSLASFNDTYKTEINAVVICDRKFSFLTPSHLEPFVDAEDIFHDFPLWAKIWEASGVLATHLACLPVNPAKRILEIGCGIGVVGITASAFGHRVTMAEYNRHALAFTRANALLNRCPDIDIRQLDWNRPTLTMPFDYIIGSEVIYRKKDIPSILLLFQTLLKPGGSIYLAEGVRQTGVDFWGQMEPYFAIKAKRFTLRSENQSETIVLFNLTSRTP